MKEYVLFMHRDAPDGGAPRPRSEWAEYFERLRLEEAFEGGGSLGGGISMRADDHPAPLSEHIFGYIKLRVRDLAHAEELVRQNPVYRAGGTVEIREID